MILQFHGYFEKVNENQEELMKLQNTFEKTKEDVMKVHTIEIDPPCKDEPDSASDAEWFNDYLPEDPPVMSDEEEEKTEPNDNQNKVLKPVINLSNLTYSELLDLPINFTYSFRCIKCEKSDKFPTRKELRSHYAKEHFKGTKAIDRELKIRKLMKRHDLCCDICDKNLSSTISHIFVDHKFYHYKLRPYKCGMQGCSHTTFSKNTLKQHIKFHLGDRRYGCCYCGDRRFTTKEARETHIIATHADKILDCRECGKILTRPWDIKSHFKNHRSKIMLECDRCVNGIRFADIRLLNLHKERHIFEDKYPKKFRCAMCERSFNSANEYGKHLKNHDPTSNNTLFTCPICGKTVTRNKHENLSTHERLHQKNDGNFKCPQCDQVFDKKPRLKAHIRKEHPSKQTPCDRCGKLMYEHTLTRHINTCVGGDLRCSHCPLTFESKSERYKHAQLVHIGYNCKKCDMKFANKSELNRHLKRDPMHNKKAREKLVTQQ